MGRPISTPSMSALVIFALIAADHGELTGRITPMQPQSSDDIVALERATSAFLSVRPRLFGIAYRMLGTAAEGEDIVQDVWLRWQSTDRSVVRDATAFLVTTTVRLAISLAQSARSQRETYIGPWLPEPVDTSADLLSEQNVVKHWSWRSLFCSRSSHPVSVPPTFFAKLSTIPIGISRTSFNSPRRIRVNWSPVPANTLLTSGEHK